MAVKDDLNNITRKITEEQSAKKMRGHIVEGVLLSGNLADEANERSKNAKVTSLAIENKYKDQLLAQDLNPNKDPELVDLRGGKTTAGERMTDFEDKTTVQFQQNEIVVSEIGNKVDTKSSKQMVSDLAEKEDTRTVFIAHRGLGGMAPENTVPAFDLAGQFGFKMIEGDVRKSSDGVLVMFHDPTLDRMTNGTGALNSKTFTQLKALKIDGGSRASSYPETKIATFDQFLLICRKWNMTPFVHLNDESALASTVDMLEKYKLKNKCIIGLSLGKAKELRIQGHEGIKLVISERTLANVPEMVGMNNVIAGTYEVSESDVAAIHRLGFEISDYAASNATGWRTANARGIDYYLVDNIMPN